MNVYRTIGPLVYFEYCLNEDPDPIPDKRHYVILRFIFDLCLTILNFNFFQSISVKSQLLVI